MGTIKKVYLKTGASEIYRVTSETALTELYRNDEIVIAQNWDVILTDAQFVQDQKHIIYDFTREDYYNIQKRLKEKIEEFRANDILAPLVPALVELRLLQKVALHQASHGHAGLPPIQSKEFDVSLALLKKIEEAITSIDRTDLSTI